jgi:Fe-Mn family superoxide dismutase
MTIELPTLPFASDALVPHISQETIDFHYGKHHQAYVDNLNKLIIGTEFEHKSLLDIVKTAQGPMFNNAAQVWNHTFYWNCLQSNSDEKPISPQLATAINRDFGDLAQFKIAFTKAATSFFGSGWIWLALDVTNKLQIVSTSNAANPILANNRPLLTCDVWEHAYYIDYRNARAKYLEAFWQIVNWNFVSKNFVV